MDYIHSKGVFMLVKETRERNNPGEHERLCLKD